MNERPSGATAAIAEVCLVPAGKSMLSVPETMPSSTLTLVDEGFAGVVALSVIGAFAVGDWTFAEMIDEVLGV